MPTPEDQQAALPPIGSDERNAMEADDVSLADECLRGHENISAALGAFLQARGGTEQAIERMRHVHDVWLWRILR